MEKPEGQLKLWIASGVNAAKSAKFNHVYCIYATKSPLSSYQVRWYKNCILAYKYDPIIYIYLILVFHQNCSIQLN